MVLHNGHYRAILLNSKQSASLYKQKANKCSEPDSLPRAAGCEGVVEGCDSGASGWARVGHEGGVLR
eukprot:3092863-Alexandrium_andersonii.AAC.1